MAQQLYDLPEGWEWRALQEIASLITDGTHHSPKVQYEGPALDRYRYITSKHVKNDGLRLENVTYVDSEIHREIYARCNPEYLDQLITKDGAMTGTCCLNSLEEPFSMLSSVALVKQNRALVQPDFLNHYLQSPVGQEQLLGDISGAAITRTNLKKLKVVPVPLPPIKEQKRIVAKLDALFTRIDTAIAHLQETLKLSKALFESALHGAFNPNGYENALPPGWSWKKFKDVCQLKRGYDLPKKSRVEGAFPLFSANGVTDYIDHYMVSAPGVVTGRSGTIGKVHFVETDYWPLNTALYVEDFHGNDERFIHYFLTVFDLTRFASGAAVPTLNRNSLSAEEVCVPDTVDDQRRIVTHLDALTEHTNTLESETQERLNQLTALKSSLLDAAFRGQL